MPREPSNPRRNHRPALTGPRIVAAAAAVADRDALVGVSMRTVARELGVEAMSLYHHIAGKEALLDALVDHVFAQITLPIEGDPWRPAMASHAVSAREVLAREPKGLRSAIASRVWRVLTSARTPNSSPCEPIAWPTCPTR